MLLHKARVFQGNGHVSVTVLCLLPSAWTLWVGLTRIFDCALPFFPPESAHLPPYSSCNRCTVQKIIADTTATRELTASWNCADAHHPTDVIAGLLLGVFWAAVMFAQAVGIQQVQDSGVSRRGMYCTAMDETTRLRAHETGMAGTSSAETSPLHEPSLCQRARPAH